MRLARLAGSEGPCFAYDLGHGWVPCSDPFTAFASGKRPVATGAPIRDPDLLAPCEPRVVVGIAQNGPGAPAPVQAWLKNSRTVVPSGTPVTLRRGVGRVDVEGEVAVVIGRETTGLTEQNAHEYVLGVTAVNDVSNPERVTIDPRNFEGKGGIGYTPLGPWIETDVDLERVELSVRINGEVRVGTGTNELPSSVATCLAYVASWAQLGPGDIVMTGAPFSAFAAQPGDLVEIRVAGMTLVSPCR